MKRIFSFIIAAVLVSAFAASCSQGLYPKKNKVFRVVSYNVGVFAKWDGSGIPFTAQLMKELDADVITLQELDSCATRTGGVYQVEAFAAEMGPQWGYTYAPALKPFQTGAYGVGSAWNGDRRNVVKTFNLSLPKGKGSETRALAVVEYDDVVVASTHLDHRNDSSQLAQAVLVTETLEGMYADSDKPVILCGDFNAYPESQTITYCREHWDILNDVTVTTYPRWKAVKAMEVKPQTIAETPGNCIDYIMILKNGVDYELVQTEVCVPFEAGSVFESSDHLPVYADIRF